jgi:hypothetical protein
MEKIFEDYTFHISSATVQNHMEISVLISNRSFFIGKLEMEDKKTVMSGVNR